MKNHNNRAINQAFENRRKEVDESLEDSLSFFMDAFAEAAGCNHSGVNCFGKMHSKKCINSMSLAN